MYKATDNFSSKSIIDKGRADSRFATSQANERRRYFVMTSLIGWAQAENQLCKCAVG